MQTKTYVFCGTLCKESAMFKITFIKTQKIVACYSPVNIIFLKKGIKGILA